MRVYFKFYMRIHKETHMHTCTYMLCKCCTSWQFNLLFYSSSTSSGSDIARPFDVKATRLDNFGRIFIQGQLYKLSCECVRNKWKVTFDTLHHLFVTPTFAQEIIICSPYFLNFLNKKKIRKSTNSHIWVHLNSNIIELSHRSILCIIFSLFSIDLSMISLMTLYCQFVKNLLQSTYLKNSVHTRKAPIKRTSCNVNSKTQSNAGRHIVIKGHGCSLKSDNNIAKSEKE